jgi:hypothetical protein
MTTTEEINEYLENSSLVDIYDTVFNGKVFAIASYDNQEFVKQLRQKFDYCADIKIVGSVVVLSLL